MLYVDDREPRPNVKYPNRQDMVQLLDCLGVPAKFERLQVGDYRWYDSLGDLIIVTRKASDLLQSVFDGHFQTELNQCCKMVDSYGGGKVIALMEGPWAVTDEGVAWFRGDGYGGFQMDRPHATRHEMVPGIELSLQLDNIMVMHSCSVWETAVTLSVLYKRSQNGWPSTMTRGRRLPPLHRTTDQRIARLMALVDRLPEKVALKLIQQFGTITVVVGLADENPNELLKVPGFGPTYLRKLQEAIN